MKLIWILIFYFFNYSLNASYEYIKKDETKLITERYAYIETSEFSGYSTIHIKATVKNGYFQSKDLYYGKSNEKYSYYDSYNLNSQIYYDSSEYGNYYGPNYDYYTMHFYLSIESKYKYFYFAFPDYEGNNIEIFCTTSGISVGVTWAIVLGVIVFIIILLLIFRYFKKRRIANDPYPIEITQPNLGYTPPPETYLNPVQPPSYPPEMVY